MEVSTVRDAIHQLLHIVTQRKFEVGDGVNGSFIIAVSSPPVLRVRLWMVFIQKRLIKTIFFGPVSVSGKLTVGSDEQRLFLIAPTGQSIPESSISFLHQSNKTQALGLLNCSEMTFSRISKLRFKFSLLNYSLPDVAFAT